MMQTLCAFAGSAGIDIDARSLVKGYASLCNAYRLAYETLAQLHMRAERLDQASRLLHRMRDDGVPPNASTFAALTRGFAESAMPAAALVSVLQVQLDRIGNGIVDDRLRSHAQKGIAQAAAVMPDTSRSTEILAALYRAPSAADRPEGHRTSGLVPPIGEVLRRCCMSGGRGSRLLRLIRLAEDLAAPLSSADVTACVLQLAGSGATDEALCLLQAGRRAAHGAAGITRTAYAMLLSALSKQAYVGACERVIRWMSTDACVPGAHEHNALLTAYLNADQFDDAARYLAALASATAARGAGAPLLWPETAGLLAREHVRDGRLDEALRCISVAGRHRLLDSAAYGHMCGRLMAQLMHVGRTADAVRVLEMLYADGAPVARTMPHTLEQLRRFADTERPPCAAVCGGAAFRYADLIALLRRHGMRPNPALLGDLVRGTESHGDAESVEAILAWAVDSGARLPRAQINALLSVLSRQHCRDRMWRLYEQLRTGALVPAPSADPPAIKHAQLATYRTMLDDCMRHDAPQDALRLWTHMAADGVVPDAQMAMDLLHLLRGCRNALPSASRRAAARAAAAAERLAASLLSDARRAAGTLEEARHERHSIGWAVQPSKAWDR